MELTREKLEEALKDTLLYLDIYLKDADKKGKDVDDWAYTIKDVLEHRLGSEHYSFAGWGMYGVFVCYLVIEIWKDGRIIPRCVSLTPSRAERVKDLLTDKYESEEPSKRPQISVEKQRMEHIFGFEMQFGMLVKTSDTFSPRKTKTNEESE